MSRYNDKLKEHQEALRLKTLKLIEKAIEEIKDFEGENAIITAKKLQEQTGLSRSALYKPHSLKVWNIKLWEERYVEKSRIEKKLETKYLKDIDYLHNHINELSEQISKLENKCTKLKGEIEIEKKRREVKEIEYNEEKEKNQRLLGELQRLQNEIYSRL